MNKTSSMSSEVPSNISHQQASDTRTNVISQHTIYPSGSPRESISTFSQMDDETTRSHDHLLEGASRTPDIQSSSSHDTTGNAVLETPVHPPHIHDPNNPYKPQEPMHSLQSQLKGWSPPPTYSSELPHRKRTSDGHMLEAGLVGTDNSASEIKANLQTDRQIRMAFVRKVYGLLSLQLFITIVICSWFILYEPVKNFVRDYQWLFFVSWILTFVILILLFWQRKRYPLNLILLFLFTLSISYGIGTVVSLYSVKTILQTFIITLGVFIALEVFTLQSKWDFSSWGPFLYAGIWVVIFASIVGLLFPFDQGFHIAISVIAALLFSAYIIYDTYLILHKTSPEEYVLAAVDLYLDILNLFVALLAIIGLSEK